MNLDYIWWKLHSKYRFFARLRDAYWWIAHRTWARYDLVRIPTLDFGYHDKDSLLLHSCFSLLVDFVEKELHGCERLNKSIQAIEQDMFTPGRVDEEPWLVTELSGKEVIRDLYLYWTIERPKLLKDNDGDELDIYYKDNEQLTRLITVREQMWT
jgi:hypothetical protein